MARRHFGSVRRLSSGRFQARYTDRQGQSITGPAPFRTKGEALRWLATVEADMARGALLDASAGRRTFADWVEEWLRTKPGQRAATLARDRAALRTHVLPRLGHLQMAAVTPSHIRDLVQAMQAAELSPKSVRTYVGTLQAAFSAAVDADVIPRSPVRVRTLGLEPVQRRPRPTLTPEQLLALSGAVPARFGALVLLAGVAGLRWGEAVGLRIGDVDFLRRTITVAQTVEEVGGHVRVVAQTKSRSSKRTFGVPPFLVERLAQHIAEHRPGAAPADLLFVGSRGQILRRSFQRRFLRPAAEASGLSSELTFHGLRHVATTLLVLNGEHPKVIQARLGHADPTMSMGVYAHVPDDLDRAAAGRLEELFTSGTPTAKNARAR